MTPRLPLSEGDISEGDDPSANRLLHALFVRLRSPLAHFFQRRVRSSAEAEDLVQEVFERLSRHQNLKALEHNSNLGGAPGSSITAKQTIYHDRERPSHLVFYVM